jgi:4-hydroxy-L-threonine phosphate dehydrogenase PdxA
MGDPAGIGPQIVAKALQNTALTQKARFVIYGANESLTVAADACKLQIRWDRVDANSARASQRIHSNILVFDDSEEGLPLLKHKPSKLGGIVSKRWVEQAITDALLPSSHAGENGLLGDEEDRLIIPAIKVAQNNGLNVSGPFPADTIFRDASSFDVIVAMYHDQGLLPVKLLSPQSAVNWTVGIPIIRTSPDHGTAFDIANTDKANATSLNHAITLAYQLVTTPSHRPMLKSHL